MDLQHAPASGQSLGVALATHPPLKAGRSGPGPQSSATPASQDKLALHGPEAYSDCGQCWNLSGHQLDYPNDREAEAHGKAAQARHSSLGFSFAPTPLVLRGRDFATGGDKPATRRSLSAAISDRLPLAISPRLQSPHRRSPAPVRPHSTTSPSPDTSSSSSTTRRAWHERHSGFLPAGRRGRSPGCPEARTGVRHLATAAVRQLAIARPVGRGCPFGIQDRGGERVDGDRGHEHNRCIQCGPLNPLNRSSPVYK